jgi:hypothetical protein
MSLAATLRSGRRDTPGTLAPTRHDFGAELLEVGDDIGDVFVGRQAGKNHLCPNHSLRVLQIGLEVRLSPGDAGSLVGFRVIVAGIGPGLSTDHAVENRADEVFGVLADLMADLAFRGEDFFAGPGVLRGGGARRSNEQCPGNRRKTAPYSPPLFWYPAESAAARRPSLKAVT